MTVTELVEAFHQEQSRLVAAGLRKTATAAGHRYQLRKLVDVAGEAPARTLRPIDFVTLTGSRHFLQSVEQAFAWAASVRLLPENPIGRLPKPPGGMRERVATREELAVIMRHAPRPFRLFLAILRRTIARPGEIRAIRWADVDLPNRVIRLRDYKCKSRRKDKMPVRTIPLDPTALRLLSGIKRNRNPLPTDHVFVGRLGKPLTSHAVRQAMSKACERAGVNQDGERLVLYTIRHTGATEATRAGVRDRLLADIMGHTTTATTARYQHLELGDLIRGIDRLANARARRGEAG